MRRIFVLLALILAAAGVHPARAEDPFSGSAYVVVDRGQGAAGLDQELRDLALELVPRLQAQGRKVTVLLAGASASGRPRLYTADPSPDVLERALAREEGMRFEGPSDARHVLRTIQQRHAGPGSVDVLLLGPFADLLPESEEVRAREAQEAWNEKGPSEARVLPVRTSPAGMERLSAVRGLRTRGCLLLAIGPVELKPEPWSPFELPEPLLRLDLSISLRTLAVGVAPSPPPLVVRGAAADQITPLESETGLRARVQRPASAGRELVLAVQRSDDPDVIALVAPPEPIHVDFPDPKPDWRLEGADESPSPAFRALSVEVDAPVEKAYRLLRTRSGPVSPLRALVDSGELPLGLTVHFGDDVVRSSELHEVRVSVRFEAVAARTVQTAGTLRIESDGWPGFLRLPFEVSTAPGRWRIQADEDDPQVRLPMARSDEGVALHIVAENANVPENLELAVQWDPPEAGQGCELRLEDERGTRFRPDAQGRVEVGSARRLRVRVESHDLQALLDPLAGGYPATLSVRPAPRPGVQAHGHVQVRIVGRSPRIVLHGESARWRRENREWVIERPLLLRLDADGGEGDWLLALHKTAPAVKILRGDVPLEVAERGPGLWEALPPDASALPRAEVFEDRETELPLRVSWTHGRAPEDVRVPIGLTARWGARGWILVGLAGLALLLGVLAFFQLRPPPLRGTLLYTARSLGGTVGRLELGVPRRQAEIVRDSRDRLSLGGAGDVLASVRATRVGGVLMAPAQGEAPAVRRLLVDGLQLQLGDHTLRYVSGLATEVETRALLQPVDDLLGPEFDLASGRVEDLQPDEADPR